MSAYKAGLWPAFCVGFSFSATLITWSFPPGFREGEERFLVHAGDTEHLCGAAFFAPVGLVDDADDADQGVGEGHFNTEHVRDGRKGDVSEGNILCEIAVLDVIGAFDRGEANVAVPGGVKIFHGPLVALRLVHQVFHGTQFVTERCADGFAFFVERDIQPPRTAAFFIGDSFLS